MIIKYGCVKLRAVEEKDFELLLNMINAPEIENMTGGWHYPISCIVQKRWMENFENSDHAIKLMIELKNLKTIGMISLENVNWKDRTAEVSYKISADLEDRIKGDTLDALKGILEYAFYELGMNCIYAKILEDNYLSRNLCKRAGFIEEGILRKRIYKKGNYINFVSVSILKEEFERE